MILHLFWALIRAETEKSVQIEVSIDSNYRYASPFLQTICHFNRFHPHLYKCLKSSVSKAKRIPDDREGVLNLVSPCIGRDTDFLRYLLSIDYYAPRVAFYTNISNSDDWDTLYDFEPKYMKPVVMKSGDSFPSVKEDEFIRPISSSSDPQSFKLSGYTVELRPFRYSMEYGVKDTAKTQKPLKVVTDNTSLPFKIPSKQPPAEKVERSFYTFLDSAPKDKRLRLLRRVIENWPVMATRIADIKADQDVNDEIFANSDIPDGLTVNGRSIDVETVDAFSMADIISEELQIQSVLKNHFGLDRKQRHEVTLHGFSLPEIWMDIRDAPIEWMNDIETDSRYKKWPSTLRTIPETLSDIPKIRKNIVNVVLMCHEDSKRLTELRELVETGFNIRAGLIKLPSSQLKQDDVLSNRTQISQFPEDSFWINGRFYTEGDLSELLLMHFIAAARPVEDSIEFLTIDEILSAHSLTPRLVPQVHLSRWPVSVPEASSLKDVQYDYSDPDPCQITCWVVSSSLHIRDQIHNYFTSPHKYSTRVAFMESLPEGLTQPDEYENLLYVNGRVISLPSDFSDFSVLFEYYRSDMRFLSKIISGRSLSDLTLYWSAVAQSSARASVSEAPFEDPGPDVIVQNGNKDLRIRYVTSPFNRMAPKVCGILESLGSVADSRILLRFANESIPTTFSRYVFSEGCARFSSLSKSVTYSTSVLTPESWFILRGESQIDMDNILPNELPPGRYSLPYDLKGFVFEGFMTLFNSSPLSRRLVISADKSQLTLGNGYFQFIVPTGVLRFSMNNQTFVFTVSSNYIPYAHAYAHSPGSQHLGRAEDDGGIHIFAVTGGQLYERLAKIMMLSVFKHTTSSAHFYFPSVFLSSSFRSEATALAKQYHGHITFIDYHWPKWISRQSERQREIWGTKILFLDSLFPLNVSRVIYVDSDQIVRTDMRELMQLNMSGRVYAFPKFCESRTETEPFRFWKKGFWKKALNGRSYHISALFCVDLNEFRIQGAGDILRETYNHLVKDPGSLANLDQDLPNICQSLLPIYTLESQWLWCETWCDDESMNNAKTIDMCNNPLTKKPKLDIARERVPEWTLYDAEVSKKFDKEL